MANLRWLERLGDYKVVRREIPRPGGKPYSPPNLRTVFTPELRPRRNLWYREGLGPQLYCGRGREVIRSLTIEKPTVVSVHS